MRRGLVLDIETRTDRLLLAASGRRAAPRDMPAALQTVAAAALLAFDVDDFGRYSGFRLSGLHVDQCDEATLVGVCERELCDLFSAGGELVSYNGAHDLAVLRLALLRSLQVGGGGVARWLDDPGGRHADLMKAVAGAERWPRLADLSSALGFGPGLRMDGVGIPCERQKAEVDVVRTLLLHMFLEAERMGDPTVITFGAIALGRFVNASARRHPHLRAILKSPLYLAAASALSGTGAAGAG